MESNVKVSPGKSAARHNFGGSAHNNYTNQAKSTPQGGKNLLNKSGGAGASASNFDAKQPRIPVSRQGTQSQMVPGANRQNLSGGGGAAQPSIFSKQLHEADNEAANVGRGQ